MPSPYVRRRQLAAEIRELRESRGLTTDGLARLMFYNRAKISRLENAQVRPDVGEIMNMLDTLEITGSQYDRLLKLTREAAHKGWWDKYGVSMGPRQKLAADLEYNSTTVRSYDQTAMPGALQCRPFIDGLVSLDESQKTLDYEPDRMAEARERRQRELLRAGGPAYEIILDESVIHRLAVPAEAMVAQLRHMIQTVSAEERITVQVLMHNARIPGGFLPKASFYLYTFADPGDQPIAIVDTVTTDLVLTKHGEVARYTGIYDRLREAALSTDDSIAFLTGVADRLTNQTGSGT
ncbi:helix-turn-helix domain-containing protein [Actinomadura bangladeshensis]|uniref:Helix-turn-helix domain-containing protein n=1 Tax=Actinomadura bangladeshensis TaxID=453573 RepID=A0A6L9QPB9_9ACTN|nr:helix-turn-helix transcriptional regulator [Actinomadura bangladeshensis]NEA27331.1 helix-turn-helix domain-containing protein [Actinomadura bangladeshensis]